MLEGRRQRILLDRFNGVATKYVAPTEGPLTETDTVIDTKTMEAVSRALSPAT
jgi:hypothetical protein